MNAAVARVWTGARVLMGRTPLPAPVQAVTQITTAKQVRPISLYISILHRVLDSYCSKYSSLCLAHLTPERVGVARSVHVKLEASPHLYERASTFSSWHDIVLSALSADSNSSKWTRAHLYRWPSVQLGWSLRRATQLIKMFKLFSMGIMLCSVDIFRNYYGIHFTPCNKLLSHPSY